MITPYFYSPQIYTELVPQFMYAKYIKRTMDILVSLLAIILVAPMLLTLAVLIRIKLGGPVLFRQTRAGYRGNAFQIVKFRTMTDERDENGELLPDAVRLTPFGQFLRKWSLDELPQLWNVLKGDLSLIGPRPLLMSYLELYNEEQARRHDIKPGVTGWAQVNGRNAISWEKKFEYDVEYVDQISLTMDIQILRKTAMKLLRPQGISQAGHATAPVFTGTKASA